MKWSTCGGVVVVPLFLYRCSAADDVNWQGRVQSVRTNSEDWAWRRSGGLAKASYCRDRTRGKGNSGNSLLVTFDLTFIGLSAEGPVEPVGAVGLHPWTARGIALEVTSNPCTDYPTMVNIVSATLSRDYYTNQTKQEKTNDYWVLA